MTRFSQNTLYNHLYNWPLNHNNEKTISLLKEELSPQAIFRNYPECRIDKDIPRDEKGRQYLRDIGLGGLIDWRLDAEWFLTTLVDADLADNSASWQWVAGSGVDAAPYFRIFNPVNQSEKFDPNGDYIRR